MDTATGAAPAAQTPAVEPLTLDALYQMTAYIYGEQNSGRSRESTFAHFVEVCGMLASLSQNKRRSSLDLSDALCKALGWFFPLMGAFNIKSLERVIFRKFPYICPYCAKCPHDPANCKDTTGISLENLNHDEISRMYRERYDERPTSLNAWQQMFQAIYQRNRYTEMAHSALGLMEEVGELAEAIRVFERHPRYFVGEAADVFSYLMGIANQYTIIQTISENPPFDFDAEYISRYPGLCIECGYTVCRCPHIPDSTIGRMAKEIAIASNSELFYLEKDFDGIEEDSRRFCSQALANIGGYEGLLNRFPLDRGEVNSEMAIFASRLADEVEPEFTDFATDLRRYALQLRNSETDAGAKHHSESAREVMKKLQELFAQPQAAEIISENEDLKRDLTRVGFPAETKHILLVMPMPDGEAYIRLDREYRAISTSLKLGPYRNAYNPKCLPAATLDDLRREVLNQSFTIVHLSGHGGADGMMFESEGEPGKGIVVPWNKILEFLHIDPTVECVIFNSCNSEPNALTTKTLIWMTETITDSAAIEFSKGFYDGLAAGRNYAAAFKQGQAAANLKGHVIHAHYLPGTAYSNPDVTADPGPSNVVPATGPDRTEK
jgi:NTP pyrophosphatase (non-canonical NTP hydrolase)